MWGTTPGDRARVVLCLAGTLGGPALGLVAIDRFRFLDDRTFTAAVILYALVLPLFFLIVRDRIFPVGTPLSARIAARVGWALSACFMVIGVVGIANGYNTPLEARLARCVGKRETLQRDEARRTHYLRVRAWPGSARVVEIEAPRNIYESISPGSDVRLIVGKGRLGLEWIQRVELPPSSR